MTIKVSESNIGAKEEMGIPDKCLERFLRIKVKK